MFGIYLTRDYEHYVGRKTTAVDDDSDSDSNSKAGTFSEAGASKDRNSIGKETQL